MARLLARIIDAIPRVVDLAKDLAKVIRDKAKLEKAIEINNAGGTLTAYQKDLIEKSGTPNGIYLKTPIGEQISKIPTEYKIIGVFLFVGVLWLLIPGSGRRH